MANDGEVKKKAVRGFAAMDAAKQREIASKGGQAAHQQGTAHQFTSEEARIAGQKGGLSRGARKKAGEQKEEQLMEPDATSTPKPLNLAMQQVSGY
jgi:general stress protein YciG